MTIHDCRTCRHSVPPGCAEGTDRPHEWLAAALANGFPDVAATESCPAWQRERIRTVRDLLDAIDDVNAAAEGEVVP